MPLKFPNLTAEFSSLEQKKEQILVRKNKVENANSPEEAETLLKEVKNRIEKTKAELSAFRGKLISPLERTSQPQTAVRKAKGNSCQFVVVKRELHETTAQQEVSL